MESIDIILRQADEEKKRGNIEASDALLRHAQSIISAPNPESDPNVIALAQATEHLKYSIIAFLVAGLLACISLVLFWAYIQSLPH